MSKPVTSNTPLHSLDEWEDFLKERYPAPAGAAATTGFKATDPGKKTEQFRDYETNARPTVREFYRLNHQHQTHEFGLAKRREFLGVSIEHLPRSVARQGPCSHVDNRDQDHAA